MNGTNAVFISYMYKASHTYKNGEVRPLLMVSVINPVKDIQNRDNLPQTLYPTEESCIPDLLKELETLSFCDEVLCDMRGRYLNSRPQLFSIKKVLAKAS